MKKCDIMAFWYNILLKKRKKEKKRQKRESGDTIIQYILQQNFRSGKTFSFSSRHCYARYQQKSLEKDIMVRLNGRIRLWEYLKYIERHNISWRSNNKRKKKNKGFENELDILCTQRCNIFAIRKVRKKMSHKKEAAKEIKI